MGEEGDGEMEGSCKMLPQVADGDEFSEPLGTDTGQLKLAALVVAD